MTYRSNIILFILMLLIIFGAIGSVHAQSVTATATPAVETDKTQQIEDLKDRLATKVAELRQTQKRAVNGTIKSVSVASIVVETKTKDVKVELTDDIVITQLIGIRRTVLNQENLEAGDPVVIFGDYDPTLDLLSAKVIFIQGTPVPRASGTITSIDSEDFSFVIATADGRTFTIDYERTTAASEYTTDKTLIKAGFSALDVGDVVHLRAITVATDDNRLSAKTIVILGSMGATATSTPTPTDTTTGDTALTPTLGPTRQPTAAPASE